MSSILAADAADAEMSSIPNADAEISAAFLLAAFLFATAPGARGLFNCLCDVFDCLRAARSSVFKRLFAARWSATVGVAAWPPVLRGRGADVRSTCRASRTNSA